MLKSRSDKIFKTIVIVAIMIPIALLHFVTGEHYRGPYPLFVNGYLLDILLPLGFYFLLCLSENLIFRSWLVRGALVFGAAFAVEMGQRMGFPLLGRTYDPWDIVMYALGVLLAVGLDTLLFPRVFRFWKSGPQESHWDKEPLEGPFNWRY